MVEVEAGVRPFFHGLMVDVEDSGAALAALFSSSTLRSSPLRDFLLED